MTSRVGADSPIERVDSVPGRRRCRQPAVITEMAAEEGTSPANEVSVYTTSSSAMVSIIRTSVS